MTDIINPIPTLTTERLVLRAFTLEDALDVQRLAGDRAIAATTMLIPHPYPENAARDWIITHKTSFTSGESATFAITLRDDGELIGSIGLTFDNEAEQAELGYWIGVPYWNRGYCTEAAAEVLRYGFEDCRLRRIHAHHLGSNPASGRVMAKLGMIREGTLRRHIRKWGQYDDAVWYGILRQEYSQSVQSKTTGNAEDA